MPDLRENIKRALHELTRPSALPLGVMVGNAIDILVDALVETPARSQPPSLEQVAAWLHAGADEQRAVGTSAFDESVLPIYQDLALQIRALDRGERTLTNPTPRKIDLDAVLPEGLWRWTHDPECYTLRRSNGQAAATVWTSGRWHTWNVDGVGGENSTEPTVEAAMREALDSLIRQGWSITPKKCSHCDGSRYEPDEEDPPTLADVECVGLFDQVDGPAALCDEVERLPAPKGPRDFSAETTLERAALDAIEQATRTDGTPRVRLLRVATVIECHVGEMEQEIADSIERRWLHELPGGRTASLGVEGREILRLIRSGELRTSRPHTDETPEGWTWVETATPGEIRLVRAGTGWPTLCLLNGDLNVINPGEHTTVLPKHVLDAMLQRSRQTRGGAT